MDQVYTCQTKKCIDAPLNNVHISLFTHTTYLCHREQPFHFFVVVGWGGGLYIFFLKTQSVAKFYLKELIIFLYLIVSRLSSFFFSNLRSVYGV
jgi:hypothetical protein